MTMIGMIPIYNLPVVSFHTSYCMILVFGFFMYLPQAILRRRRHSIAYDYSVNMEYDLSCVIYCVSCCFCRE